MKTNNELIHEYMGRDWTKEQFMWRVGAFTPMTIEHLKHYETSWNWLMPVVEKISKENEGVRIVFGNVNTYCKIEGVNVRFTNFSEKPIEAVYKTVVDFINYQNRIIKP